MARTRLEGHDMMLFDSEGKSFAFGTNSSLSIEAAMVDVSDKDTGIYGAQEPGQITWSITSDHTLSLDDYYKFYEAQQQATKMKVWYGLRKGYKGGPDQNDSTYGMTSQVNDGTDGNRTIDSTSYALTGYVYVQSITQNASNGDKANYSVTLQGSGRLDKEYFPA